VSTVVAPRCEYIHARLGWAQGPQLADPSAPECQSDVALQLKVWKTLVEAQFARQDDSSNNNKAATVYASPEYGPPPYLPVQPHTQEPVASLSEAVAYTKKLLEDLLASMVK